MPINIPEIRARADAATSGPWYQGRDDRSDGWRERSNEAYTRRNPNDHDSFDAYPTQATPEDAAFVAHARTDIPDLLDEVERLAKIIEDAPHAFGCQSKFFQQTLPCSCWKAAL